MATEEGTAGPLLHAAFEAALKSAERVAGETAIHERRVSIPSVAVADFAEQIFERFDDKRTLVIAAGEMAEETLQYLKDQGARDVTVVNRSPDRAAEAARCFAAPTRPWEEPDRGHRRLDVVISTTGASEPIVAAEQFAAVETRRRQRSRPRAHRSSFSTWRCRGTSTRPSATGPRSISIRSTTSVPPASGTSPCETRSCRRRRGSSGRKRNVLRPTCTTVRPARSSAN